MAADSGTILRLHLPPNPTSQDFAEARAALDNLCDILPDILPDISHDEEAHFSLPGIEKSDVKSCDISHDKNIEKALKPGGRAHAGLSLKEVELGKKQALLDTEKARGSFLTELAEVVNGWSAAVRLGNVATTVITRPNVETELDEVMKPLERQSRRAIREGFRKMWILGKQAAGNFQPLTEDEKKKLASMQRVQQQYFINYLLDIRYGTLKMGAKQRVNLYGNAIQEAFWAGFVMADMSQDRWFQWVMDFNAEHCGDCAKLAKGGRWNNGIYRAKELVALGIFPRSGRLKCCTNCKCELKEVEKPKARPIRGSTRLADIKLDGVMSDSFSGQGREGRSHLSRRADRYRMDWGRRKVN